MRLVVVAMVAWFGCAPDVPSARERAELADRDEAAQLERQLRAIPGVVTAHAAIHHAFRDPLTGVGNGSAAGVLLAIDGHANREAITQAAGTLAPGASLAVVTAPAVAKPGVKGLAIGGLILVLAAALTVAYLSRGARRSTR